MPPSDELVRERELSIRRMRRDPDDLALLLSWRRAPHVRAFWDNDDDGPEITMDFIEDNYVPLTDHASTTTPTFIELDGRPIGYLQFYRWLVDDPEGARATSIPVDDDAFGIDVFIGEPTCTGRGIGSRAVDLVCRYLFETHGASRVALLTAEDNLGAQRAYEKAGFVRVRRALDTDTRGGVRIPSWLMVRERPSG
jgi:RimJ/RimL family protein N-acetyltransferase